MPRKKKDDRANSSTNFRTMWIDFNDRQRSEIAEFGNQRDFDLSGILEQFTTDGWKISLSYSGHWGTNVLSITPKEVPTYDSNVVYLFRHKDFNRIIDIMRYFFGVMVPNDDSRLRGEVTDDNW